MGRSKKYGKFELTDEEVKFLTTITNTRTEEAQKVQRAKILLLITPAIKQLNRLQHIEHAYF